MADEQINEKPASKELTLKWKKGPSAPTCLQRGSSVIIGDIVYITNSEYEDRNVYSFDYTSSEWSTLLFSYSCSVLTTINNILTTVGGIATDKLFTRINHKWVEEYPPMPKVKHETTVLSTATHLAVMGGYSQSSGWLDCVEVMDIAARQWSSAAQLPFMTRQASATLCGDSIYFMGGATPGADNSYSVLTCQFDELIQSSKSGTETQPSSTPSESKVWRNLPDLPLWYAACVTVDDKVLAIGGADEADAKKSSIYELNTDTNEMKWRHKGNMSTGRSYCLATVLPNNSILVVGGEIHRYDTTDETEIATISY